MKILGRLAQNEYFGLVLILLLAFSLRLYGLASVGINNDDYIDYMRWISASFRKIMIDDLVLNNQTFVHILDRVSLLMLGDKLFSLRWPSFCISILGIVFIYRLTRGLFGRGPGILSALLLAISPYSIFFAHSFRGYGWVIAVPILVYLLGLLALQTGKRRYWLFIGVVSALMMYTHLFTALAFFNLILVMGLIWWLGGRLGYLKKPALTGMALSVGVIAVMLLVFYAPIWAPVLRSIIVPEESIPSDLLWVVRPSVSASVLYNLRLFNGFWQPGSIGGDGVYLLIGLILIGLSLTFTARFRWQVLAVLAWAGLPFVEIGLARQFLTNFWARPNYVAYTMPPLLILASLGTVQITRFPPIKRLKAPVLVASIPILLLAGFWYVALQEYYQIFVGAEWQAIENLLHKNVSSSDLVVCHRYNQPWRDDDVEYEDLCTRTLNRCRKADTAMAMNVLTSQELVYSLLPRTNFGAANRNGRVWVVVWNVPETIQISDITTAGLTVTEFKRFGRSLILLVDQNQSYVTHLAQALIRLRSTVQEPEQKFIYSLLVASLAGASGQTEVARASFDMAKQNIPDHPDAPAKLASTLSMVETISLPVVDHPLQVNFGEEIALNGYNVRSLKLTPGSKLELTLFWQALRPVGQDYSVFFHVRSQEGQTVTQQDYQPFYGSYPTRFWQPGQHLADVRTFPIPADFPAGTYNLFIGLYNPGTLERLTITGDQSGENAFLLSSLVVE